MELETLFMTTLSQHIHQGQAHSEKELEEALVEKKPPAEASLVSKEMESECASS